MLPTYRWYFRTVTAGVRGLRPEEEESPSSPWPFTLRRFTRVTGEPPSSFKLEARLRDEGVLDSTVTVFSFSAFFLRLTFTITLASMLTSSSKLNS